MKREIDLAGIVWGYVDQCFESGLYGDNMNEVVLSLMRTGGLEQAARIGIIKLAKRNDEGGASDA